MEAAATRELLEETSVDLEITSEQLTKVTSTKGRDPRGWIISIAYKIIVDERAIKPRANSDALYASWVKLSTLKKDEMAFDHYDIIMEVLK